MLRGSLFLLVILTAGLIHFSSTQTPVVKLLGLACSQDTLYEIDSALQCCSEDNIVPVSMANATACAAYCTANGSLPSMYGRYLDGVYIECVCLTNCISVSDFGTVSSFSSILGYFYTSNSIPSSTVQDLASGATPPNIEQNIQPNSLAQLRLSSTQTATFQTTSDSNGNLMHFLATVTTAGLPAGANLGFTLRNMKSYTTFTLLQLDYKWVNNSFEVIVGTSAYNPPVQYKRQSTDLYTYTMFHQGSGLIVVLSLNGEAVMSWEYNVMITNVDSTTAQPSTVNSLQFDLAVGYKTTVNYASCSSNQCFDSHVLSVCNGSFIERRYCYLGCNYISNDCVQCDASNCKGTCESTPTPRCVCSQYQIGSDCSLDISTASLTLSSYHITGAEVAIDVTSCTIDKTCVAARFFTPTVSSSLDKYCCSNQFELSSITRMNGSDVLNFTSVAQWNCAGANQDILAARFPSVLSLQYLDFPGQLVFTWFDDPEGSQLYNSTGTQYISSCDQVSLISGDASQAIILVSIPVSVSFMAASCAAVIIGFAVGSVSVPNGMTVKRREPLAKGCIPKYNGDLANSIVATCVLDVALVTVCGVIGTYYPISLLIFASGILLVIMTYQIQDAGKRFGNIPRTAHNMLTVQKVFGRVGGAFLIVLGLTIFIIGLSTLLLGQFIVIVVYVGPVLAWLMLAVYCTWALVIVHFAGAIYVCVCFYYTAARLRNQDQESVRVHTVELEEPSEDNFIP